jgi:hypothetical protein
MLREDEELLGDMVTDMEPDMASSGFMILTTRRRNSVGLNAGGMGPERALWNFEASSGSWRGLG